jgi:hypothetical protein
MELAFFVAIGRDEDLTISEFCLLDDTKLALRVLAGLLGVGLIEDVFFAEEGFEVGLCSDDLSFVEDVFLADVGFVVGRFLDVVDFIFDIDMVVFVFVEFHDFQGASSSSSLSGFRVPVGLLSSVFLDVAFLGLTWLVVLVGLIPLSFTISLLIMLCFVLRGLLCRLDGAGGILKLATGEVWCIGMLGPGGCSEVMA